MVLISSFFVFECVGLYLVTHAFSKSLSELHQTNRLANVNRQIRQLLGVQRNILETLREQPRMEGRLTYHAASAKSLELMEELESGIDSDGINKTQISAAKEALVRVSSMEDAVFKRGDISRPLVVGRQYVLEGLDALNFIFISQLEQSDRIFQKVYAERFTPLFVSLGLGILFVTFALVLGLRTARNIGSSIANLLVGTQTIASGDLSYRVPVLQKDEIGQVADAFNQMTATLQETTVSKDQLVQSNQALAHANRELESFSYSVSHDLRSPLRSIDGFSQALLEDYGDKLDPGAQDFLSRIRSATQKMGMLIDDMLNLSRISRAQLVIMPVDLSQLARSIMAEFKEQEPDRQVEFRCADGLTARMDPGLARILMFNLLGNAWKYSSKKDRAVIEFGRTEHEGKTKFFVRDNGAGFDMAYVDKLFGAFQRLHTQTEFMGTGVGLATVQRIVSRHGGTVDAYGKTGEGATFYFTVGGC